MLPAQARQILGDPGPHRGRKQDHRGAVHRQGPGRQRCPLGRESSPPAHYVRLLLPGT
jgi:hypothetical protein